MMNNDYINYFNNFEIEYEVITNSSNDFLAISVEIVEYIKNKLKEIYKWLKKYLFQTIQEEIYFFKELKPKLVSKLIYHKELLKLASTLPQTKKDKKKQYGKLLTRIHQYGERNTEFYEYYRSKASHKDKNHFVRHGNKDIISEDCSLINYDKKRSTSHDIKVAIIMANDMFTNHLENKLEELNRKVKIKNNSLQFKFNWTGSKVDLTEMVYGFQASGCINNGNVDLKELAIFMGTMFNIEIDSNLYGHYSDIKSRKISKTKFINTMSEKLLEKMDHEDSKKKLK